MKAIIATDSQGGFARKGNIPWYEPNDLRFFQAMTEGCSVLMGRYTANSLPGGLPLPNRRNIVLTRCFGAKLAFEEDGFEVADWGAIPEVDWCIGGEDTLRMLEEHIDEFWVTRVPGVHDCDVFFHVPPGFSKVQEWSLPGQEGELKVEVWVRND